MEEVEFNVKELFHFMNTHTDEFFVRVRLDEEGGLCGETDGCSVSETDKGFKDYEYKTNYDAYGCSRASW